MCIKIQKAIWEKWGTLVRDRSFVEWEQSTFKQQQTWESGTPENTLETTRTKPQNNKACDQVIRDQLVSNAREKFSKNQSKNPK